MMTQAINSIRTAEAISITIFKIITEFLPHVIILHYYFKFLHRMCNFIPIYSYFPYVCLENTIAQPPPQILALLGNIEGNIVQSTTGTGFFIISPFSPFDT